MADHLLLVCCFLLAYLPVVFSIRTYEMTDRRDQTLNMARKLLFQGRMTLTLTSDRQVGSFQTSINACGTGGLFELNTLVSCRLMFYFEKNQLPCNRGHLSFHNGPSEDDQAIAGLDRVCDTMPRDVSVTTGHYLTIKYTEMENGAGSVNLSVIFTSFREGSCKSGEFHCENNRCIVSTLSCNGFNSCGDDSSCPSVMKTSYYVVVAVCCVVVAAFIGSCIACCLCCHICRRNRSDRQAAQLGRPGFTTITHPTMGGQYSSNTENVNDPPQPPQYKELSSQGFTIQRNQKIPSPPSRNPPVAPTAPSA